MLGCRGDTEDGPGTLTGTHARRTPRCCAARSPAQVPGREMCPHTARRAAAARSNTNTSTHGAGERLLPKNGMGQGSFIHQEANFSFFSFLHPLRFH